MLKEEVVYLKEYDWQEVDDCINYAHILKRKAFLIAKVKELNETNNDTINV